MEDVERLLTQVEDLLDRGLEREASEIIGQVIPLLPEDPDLLFRAGCAALNARMGEEAVDYLEAAHELSPQDPEILTRLADAATFVGDIDLARMCVETAFSLLDDYDFDLRMTSGYLLEKQHRFEDAITHFRQFAADYPDGADIRARLGYALMMTGMYREAADEIAFYLKENPADRYWTLQLALCYGGQGMSEEACEYFRSLVDSDPTDTLSRAFLALSMADRGLIDEAKREITQALLDTPEDDVIKDIYTNIMDRGDGKLRDGFSRLLPTLLAGLHLRRRDTHMTDGYVRTTVVIADSRRKK